MTGYIGSHQVSGHTLMNEGAAFDEHGARTRTAGSGGTGRGKCSCGELSDVLTSGAQRKTWHREHKQQVTGARDHDAGPVDKLADAIAKAQNVPFTGAKQRRIAAAIREQFDVRAKTSARLEPPIPAIGQTWRNRQSDRLVRIVEIQTGYNRSVVWEAPTGRGPKAGRVWIHYWTHRFDFVDDAA